MHDVLKLLLPVVLWSSVLGLSSCTAADDVPPENCETEGAYANCLTHTMDEAYYAALGHAYFDTMDYSVETDGFPPYSQNVARWEWPPWLKLTAYTRENIETTDTLLVLYPSVVEERDCRTFDVQPFARCKVTFYYDAHDGKPCPIYEEFTFNDQGEITFIEAWSNLPDSLPMVATDTWAEGDNVTRLSSRIPGLGNETGMIDLDSVWMAEAAAEDVDVEDFVIRANDWLGTWSAELVAAGDDLWERGCGW